MVVPISVSAQFRRLDKNLNELRDVRSDTLSEDQSILVAEICNSCILTLDKVMNAIWEAKSERKEGKSKPKIYFPISSRSREDLIKKLQQYQMPDLHKKEPNIFAIIDNTQPYNNVKWLRALHKLTGIRHEDFPKVSQVKNKVIGIGRGQNLYIESMSIDEFGKIKFNGHGINRENQKIEPVRFEFLEEVRSVLEEVGEEPCQFCSSSVAKVKHVVSALYKHIHRQ